MSYIITDKKKTIGVLLWADPADKHSELMGDVFDVIGFHTYNAYITGIIFGESSLPAAFREAVKNETQ